MIIMLRLRCVFLSRGFLSTTVFRQRMSHRITIKKENNNIPKFLSPSLSLKCPKFGSQDRGILAIVLVHTAIIFH